MRSEDELARESERSAALDGWVAAFDREMQQNGDFATSIAAMTAHGCFDVRAVAERWTLANPTGDAPPAQVQPAPEERAPLRLVTEEDAEDAAEEAEEAEAAEEAAPPEPASASASDPERPSRKPEGGSSPDIAYFRSLLQGGIERSQIDEAFPGFRLVIDEAVGQHDAGAEPILSEIPAPPTREDLNDEIRGMREKLQASAARGRRRWRSRD